MTPKLHSTRLLTDTDRDDLVQRYLAGVSMAELERATGRQRKTISDVLKARGVRIRSLSESRRTLAANHQAFSEWIPEACYWAGFIHADGCITQRAQGGSRVLEVHLARKDRCQLEALRSFLGSEHKIVDYNSVGFGGPNLMSIFSIASPELSADLTAAGVKDADQLADALFHSPDFWRGAVDGDGSVKAHAEHPGQDQLVLNGDLSTIRAFQSFLHSRGLALGCNPGRVSTIWKLATKGTTAQAVAGLLYPDGCVALARKAEQAAVLRAQGRGRPLLKVTEEMATQAMRDYTAGHTVAEVAVLHGVSAQTIRRAFARHGFKLRTRSERALLHSGR